jgi:multiple sugar transport system permease protein
MLARLFLSYAALVLLTAVFVAPLLWMLSTSLKPNVETTRFPPEWIPTEISGEGYSTILTTSSQTPVFQWFLNSVVAASAYAVLVLVTASLAAYALARMNFRGKNILFAVIIATLFIPQFVFLIPNYLIVSSFGWLNTLLAVIVPNAAWAFGVFFMRQFFLSLPREIEEAALIDFLWPVYVLFSPGSQTLPPGLTTLQNSYTTNYTIIMAGGVIASIPVLLLYMFAQRYVIEGVSRSGLKG